MYRPNQISEIERSQGAATAIPGCTCGAGTDGPYADVHTAGCPALAGTPMKDRPAMDEAHKIADVIALLSAAVRAYDNPETETEHLAIDAAREGRPAYWTVARYSNQVARSVVEEANRSTLRKALDRFADDRSVIPAKHTASLLDDLIPLNDAAIVELTECRKAAALNMAIKVLQFARADADRQALRRWRA